MEMSFGLQFFLRKRKGKKETELPFYCRITIDGMATEISVKRKCDPNNWNASAGRATGKTDDIKNLNAYLNTFQQKVFEAKRQHLELDKPLTAVSIKNSLLGVEQKEKPTMIMEVFAKHNAQMKELIGKEYAYGTWERFTTSFNHILSFLHSQYGIKDIDVKKINYGFIADYAFWLKTVRKCDHNSTVKYLSNFKKMVIICIKNGWLTKDPFTGFSLAKKEVDKVVLSENELAALVLKRFDIQRLELVKDIFVFSCYTGLAYVDVQNLRKDNIIVGIDGNKWLSSKRQKTKNAFRVPLLEPAKNILDKYANDPYCELNNALLPVLSNQKMNAYLKEIADACGIIKNLTFHIARHTFATTVTLSNGVPLETVSKMLGHRNLATTQGYAKILDHKVHMDMEKVRLRYNSM